MMKITNIFALILILCCLLCSCGNKDIVLPSENEHNNTGVVLPSEEECRAWQKVSCTYKSVFDEDFPADNLVCLQVYCSPSCLIENADGKRLFFGHDPHAYDGVDIDEILSSGEDFQDVFLWSDDEFDVYNFGQDVSYDGGNGEHKNKYSFCFTRSDKLVINFYGEATYLSYFGTESDAHLRYPDIKQVEIAGDKIIVRGSERTMDEKYSNNISADGFEVVTELYKE